MIGLASVKTDRENLMPQPSINNPELQLARDFVQHTGSHLFLTGKAGTGKTTFLHHLKNHTAKRTIVTAPTGVAAINAGGVTLHSFFQLPFGPFIPGSQSHEKNRQRLFRFSKEKRRIIKSLDLLVIDEISMVRADLLDSVDAVLRRHRRDERPFGGVQLLMIGDLHQLSPVAKNDERQLLMQHYDSIYFFSSHALAKTQWLTIELKHIYRQSDPKFIKLLNQVRDNRLDETAIQELNRRYIENYIPDENQGYITLTTHNNNADAINSARLNALPGEKYYFEADVSGDFPENTYPAPGTLVLKKNAQVMFLRNDISAEKRYFNGKIGTIKELSNQKIVIACPGDSETIVVDPVEWENISYKVDKDTLEIKEDIIGRFKQFPLKLAWAITIHKSQGLTFEKAVIDTQAAFAHGQVYVALSRCRTLEGMVLSSPVISQGIETDDAVLRFIETADQNRPDEERLREEKIAYQQKLLLDCFDFGLLHGRLGYLIRILKENAGLVQVSGLADVERLRTMSAEQIFTVGEKFKQQLRAAFESGRLPESDAYLLERISKASLWFQEKFHLLFDDLFEKFQVETDNKELGKKIDNSTKNLRQEIAVKQAGIKTVEHGFSPPDYLRAVSKAEIDFIPEKKQKIPTPDYSESDIEHLDVFLSLKDWRTRKSQEEGIPPFMILHQRVLIQIAVTLPGSETELEQIKGVGKKTIEKYGKDILSMVISYREKHGIEAVCLPEPSLETKEKAKSQKNPTSPKLDTRQFSFDLFNQGLTVSQIASQRELVESTIEGHLCSFVENGELDINRLLSIEKQSAIETAISQNPGNSLKAIKEQLGDTASYGEIKLMLAHQRYLASGLNIN